MKLIAKSNLEASTFILFEPHLVADEFRLGNQTGTYDQTLRKLHDAGKLILIETNGDTDGHLHVYLSEELPDSLVQFVCNRNTYSGFCVERKHVLFAAIAGYIHPDEFHLPSKGSKINIPPACYDIEIVELDVSREFTMKILAERATKIQYFFFKWFDTIMIVAAIAILFSIGSLFFLSWITWLLVILFVALPVFLLPQFWCRSRPYQQALRVWSSIYKDVPSLAAVFTPDAR